MADLVSLVMEAAATELLYQEAAQIDQEVQRLLAEMEHATVEECHRGGFVEHFLELMKRRGEVARKALVIFEEPESKTHARADQMDEGRIWIVEQATPPFGANTERKRQNGPFQKESREQLKQLEALVLTILDRREITEKNGPIEPRDLEALPDEQLDQFEAISLTLQSATA